MRDEHALRLLRGIEQEADGNPAVRQLRADIVNARISLGISQKELAKQCGVSQSTISRIENGNAKAITLGALEQITAALGGTLDIAFKASERSSQREHYQNQPLPSF